MSMWRPEDKLAVVPCAGHLFFLGGEGKSRVYCVCVRAYAVEAAWKSQDEFNGVNMYMNAEHQFNIGV